MFILGDPVAHIRGTAFLNEHFRQSGRDATAAPLHVAPADLAGVVGAIRKMRNVAGFGVTLPHKIEILKHLNDLTDRAARIGAVNFVRRDGDGRLAGDNVDGLGFVAGLARNGIALAGRRVLQIGAGGVGRAIAFALAEAGAAEITLVNRSRGKAEALAAAVGAACPNCRCSSGAGDPTRADLLVNATSLGLQESDPLPIDIAALPTGAAVAEVIMAPETTALLRQAEQRGHRIVRGREMIMEQLRLATAFLEI
jgi:shikimate dehydrogenase